MASAISHMLFVKELINRLDGGLLRSNLSSGIHFLQAGAVAPDLPYASLFDNDYFFKTQSELADKFHYERTNGVPLQFLVRLKAQWNTLSSTQRRFAFSFVVGYISHLVVDGLVHPFVRDMVGNYKDHQAEHRKLELDLDVLLFHFLTARSGHPIELNYADLHDELSNIVANDYPERDVVLQLFSDSINDVYGERHDVVRIRGWIQGLHRMLEIAEGDHPDIYKIGYINTIIFADFHELVSKYSKILILEKPIDRADNFLHLPRIHYFDDVIPRVYATLIPLVNSVYAELYEGGPSLTEAELPMIDLDTGRLLAANDLNNTPQLWA